MRVLIIDDEPSCFHAIAEDLGRGHVIDFARSLESLQTRAMKYLREYDVIVCDSNFDADPTAGLLIISHLRSFVKFSNRIILHTKSRRSDFTGELNIKKLHVEYVQKPEPYTTNTLIAALQKEEVV